LAADLTAAATAVTTAAAAKVASDTATGLADADPVVITSLTTAAKSLAAIVALDNALTSVNDMRADLGAVENRLGYSVSNLQSSAENQSAAKSRIMDTDFAVETANLSRAQVLQQAGTAMVAQANQLPQGVLALLK
jgi:flagellin